MVIPNTLTLTANSLSVFVVTRNNATPGSGIVSYVQLNNGLPLYYLEIGTREMQTRFLNSAVDIPTTMQVPTGIVLHGYSVSASEVRTYMNSRVLRTAANTAATALAGGAVGYRTDTSNAFMPAEYYEVLIYNHAFTSGEYEQLRQWAAATYGAGQRENRPLRILAQGNSLTSGYAPDGMLQRTWPERLGEIMAADVYNMGQGGQPTPTLSTNAPTVIDRLIQKNTKSVCILQEGTNHLLQGVSGATAYAAFVAWGTARKALGCYVVALTVPMYNGVGNTTPRTDLNSSIVASLVTDGGADLVIDIASDSRLAGGNSGLYRGTDSTHLTELGYSVVAELIAAGLYSKGF